MNLWDRLEALRAIVDTARAEDLEQIPETIRTRYEPYAEAYFLTETVKQMEQRLIGELRSGRPVTGYISADFGYGKTATSIYIWKRLLDEGFVAVPPFLLRSLGDLMKATYGWLKYQLQQRQPSLAGELEDAYRNYMTKSLDDLAREIVSRLGIPETKAQAIVQEYIAQWRDVTTSRSLLDFLEVATKLAREAGFKGLIVFADEVQEFIRVEESGAKDAIQTLSELVKGIRAMNIPVGLVITMPVTPTEMAIEEQAGDIMHRMRERGTALRLEEVYGRTFPRQLWEYLCSSFGGEKDRFAVVESTLEALGQICERKDLSNGPRTVISAFKRIAQRYRETHRPYTPIDLIDDYIQGLIVFEGKEAKLTRTLRSLLEIPYIKGDPRKEQSIKLLAAFPKGVNEQLAGDLYPVIEDLAEKGQLLGEHIIYLSEGFALAGLQEEARRRPILDEIVRDFRRRWYHSYADLQKLRFALVAFAREIIPLLFPPRLPGQYANFGGHNKELERFERDARGVFYEILEGAFERLYARFPDRRICLSIDIAGNAINYFCPPEEVDLDIRFFLETPEDPNKPLQVVTANRDRRVDIHLNLNRTFGRQFPPDLAFLCDIMLPEHTSAQILLALSTRIWEWLKDHPDTSEADRQMMESQRGMLHRYAMQLLFPDASDPTKVELHGIKVTGAGQQLVESIFEAKCAELYPDYRPLALTKEWKSHLRRYRDALSRRPLAERRGREPFIASKEEISKTFGWSPATFESQSRFLQEMGLLKVHWGKGRGAESEARVEFLEHPLEKLLLQTLQQEGKERALEPHARRVKSLEVSRLKEIARRYGYLSDETDEALELLVLRQRVQRAADGTVHEFAGALDVEELAKQAQELEEHLNLIFPYFREELSEYLTGLEEARRYLAETEDEVLLDAAQRKLNELKVRINEFTRNQARHLANQLYQSIHSLEKRRPELSSQELEKPVTGATDFVRQVDDARKTLQKEFAGLRRELDQLKEAFVQAQQRLSDRIGIHILARELKIYDELLDKKAKLEERWQSLLPYLNALQRWREIVTRITVLRDRLEPESPLQRQLDEEIGFAILANFTSKGIEALLDWELFRAKVDNIEAELEAEENRRRQEFHEQKERYEVALGKLLSQRAVQATFDPKDPEQSYQVLFHGVLRKLQDWLREQQEHAGQLLNEWDYLIQERGIAAVNEQREAEKVCQSLRAVSERLNLEIIRNWEEFQLLVSELQTLQERINSLNETISRQRAQKGSLEEPERLFLEGLTFQRRSIENLRRELGLSLDNLFEILKSLYRKGYLELEVRRRE